ncbi:MAG: acyl-CoA dehydrogenase family protein [Gemmatimonadales bacterium]
MSDEIRMLRDAATAFVASEFPIDRVRGMAEQAGAVDPDAYRALVSQGWLAIAVPEERGGVGLGFAALGSVLEILGRALVPGPFWSAATLGVPALAATDNTAARDAWLDSLISGERRVTLALQEGASLPEAEAIETRAESLGGGRYRIHGRKRFVPDLRGADAAVVVATSTDGPLALLVDLRESGAVVEENLVSDQTSRSGTLTLDGVEVGDAARLGGWDLVERVVRIGNLGLAALAVGGADALFAQVLSYVKQRVQFGVPVGTFQAVQHPLADLFGELESARSACLYAAFAVDGRTDDEPQAVALARLVTTAAYHHAATTSLQAHGGIAFTWEHDLHLHLKRALHLGWTLGQSADYEAVVARAGLGI